MNEQTLTQPRGTVALFATCLVDLFRPSVGFASAQLLEQAGYAVDVPEAQTCCGQPAYNSGDRKHAKAIAKQVIESFRGYDYVVVPSGSCGGTITTHYPDLLRDEASWAQAARELAGRTWELTRFLVEVAHVEISGVQLDGVTTYHDSCAGLRELGIRTQPRQLLAGVEGLELREMADTDVCCGFGGTFCVKYPEISERLVSDKVSNIEATRADLVLAGDLGCLFNIAGRLKRMDKPVRAYHIAEVLAGTARTVTAIGEGEA
ncbi:(Fe-S)-binding protein [Aquisalimonas sp.]|uniref:(Fe-S)-binding protein n=1 Tax=Aquisalimonas sp. TaxID=1872621 RepID=UPI0025C03D0D|nr:(Fe-S)-binding protein [Aquisalimonas sp.]